jgi:uncharacterized integral membrane protein
VGEPKHRSRVVFRGVGFVWGFVLTLPLAAALIVFVAQNTEDVVVRWTVWKVHSPLSAVVLVTILAAVVLAETVGVLWRHQRRRTLARRSQLQTELAHRLGAAEPPGPPSPGEPAAIAQAADGENDTARAT